MDSHEMMNQPHEKEYRAFLGKNADIYLLEWFRTENGKSKAPNRMHWPAFLVGGLWLGYRKLYGFGTIIALLLAMEIAIQDLVLHFELVSEGVIEIWDRTSYALYGGIMAFFSFKAVKLKADKVIGKLRQEIIDPEARLAKLEEIGGGSYVHMVLLFAYIIVLASLLSAFFRFVIGI